MSATSATWRQMTFEDLTGFTSSLALAGGSSPCDSPGGQPTIPCGPEAAPASRSARRGSGRGRKTSGTCGPRSTDSSASAGPRSCSASKSPAPTLSERLGERLRQTGEGRGSTEYTLTWEWRVTSSGLRFSRQRASARRTSGSDSTGWPTPNHNGTGAGNEGRGGGLKIQTAAALAGWATPTAHEKARSEEFQKGRELNAREALAGWSTPTAQDHSRGNLPPRPTDTGVPLSQMVVMAGWSTPCTGDTIAATGELRPSRTATGRTTEFLARQAFWVASGWATPRANDVKGPPTVSLTHSTRGTLRNDTLPLQPATAADSGPTPSSSPAATGSGGASPRLNPAFSLWLMGFPQSWMTSGVRAATAFRSRGRSRAASRS